MWIWYAIAALAAIGSIAVFIAILSYYVSQVIEDNTVNIRGAKLRINAPDQSLIVLEGDVLEATRNLGRMLRGDTIHIVMDKDESTSLELHIPAMTDDDAHKLRKWVFMPPRLWHDSMATAILTVPFGVEGFNTNYMLTDVYPTSIRLVPKEVNGKTGRADIHEAILTLSGTWAPTSPTQQQKKSPPLEPVLA